MKQKKYLDDLKNFTASNIFNYIEAISYESEFDQGSIMSDANPFEIANEYEDTNNNFDDINKLSQLFNNSNEGGEKLSTIKKPKASILSPNKKLKLKMQTVSFYEDFDTNSKVRGQEKKTDLDFENSV